MTFELGDPVRIEMEKWGDRPHWQIPARWLGSDELGDWIGIPAGTPMTRPGLELALDNDQVCLVPRSAPGDEHWWIATFHHPPSTNGVSVYVDIATPPRWHGVVVRTVDLDLDVVRLIGGEVYIDDEDEFAEHQVELDYPREIVALAEASRDRVHAAVVAGHPPYDGSHARWQRVLDGLTARR